MYKCSEFVEHFIICVIPKYISTVRMVFVYIRLRHPSPLEVMS